MVSLVKARSLPHRICVKGRLRLIYPILPIRCLILWQDRDGPAQRGLSGHVFSCCKT